MSDPETVPDEITLDGIQQVPGVSSNTAYMYEPTQAAATMPAINGSITLTVVKAIEYAIGGYVHIVDIGFFEITGRNTTLQTITIQNNGHPANVDAASAIAIGSLIIPCSMPEWDSNMIRNATLTPFDAASIPSGSFITQAVTVAGAVLGDFAIASLSLDCQDIILHAQVTATNTVTVVLFNPQAVLVGSDTWDPASIADGDEEAKEITVTGAALGDFAEVAFSLDVADLQLTGDVTAADTVTAILANNTGGAIDLASGTISARVKSPNPIDLASASLYVMVFRRTSV